MTYFTSRSAARAAAATHGRVFLVRRPGFRDMYVVLA